MKIWTPDLVISALIITGCIVLMALGIDGEVKGVFLMAAGWVFKSTMGNVKAIKAGKDKTNDTGVH